MSMYVLNNKQNNFAIGCLSATDMHTATNLKISLLMCLWTGTTSHMKEAKSVSSSVSSEIVLRGLRVVMTFDKIEAVVGRGAVFAVGPPGSSSGRIHSVISYR